MGIRKKLFFYGLVGIIGGVFTWIFFVEIYRLFALFGITFNENFFSLGFSPQVWRIVLSFLFALITALFVFLILLFNENEKKTSHGSADWADSRDMKKYFKEGGIALGRAIGGIVHTQAHILTCAPTGSGKGIGGIIPNLLLHPGSLICLDIKGENWAVTHRQRQALGSQVCLLDPFRVTTGESVCFNWLDFIDVKTDDSISSAAMLTDMIACDAESNYFDDSAKSLIKALILHVASVEGKYRHIGTVRNLLMLPQAGFNELLKDMAQSDAASGVIAKEANKLLGTAELGAGKELSGVLNSARRFTEFLDDSRIVDILSKSDFNLSEIKEKNISVFLVMPPDKLKTYRAFVRVFFALAIKVVTSSQAQPAEKIVFFFDEFAQLGYMDIVEDGISLVRGYGAQFWIFVQDLSQLKGVYDKWQTFLANTVRVFYGCTDFDTAKYVSQMLGKKTIDSVSKNLNTEIQTQNSISRDLLTPDEVMRLKPEEPIVFMQGEPPMKLKRLNYLDDKEFKGIYDQNPFY